MIQHNHTLQHTSTRVCVQHLIVTATICEEADENSQQFLIYG